MGFFTNIKRAFAMLTARDMQDVFDVKPLPYAESLKHIGICRDVYAGRAPWVDDDHHIRSIGFAKNVCSEVARLATLGIGVELSGGSARAAWLQAEFDQKVYYNLRKWVEISAAVGTCIIKPSGQSVDVIGPDNYAITDVKNGDIYGAAFADSQYSQAADKWFTRLEYHRFEDDLYIVTNKCYIGDARGQKMKSVSIEATPWAGLAEEVVIAGLDRPLFGVLRMPMANNIDMDSPLSLPLISNALEELRDLDVAYSRNALEIFDSKRTVLLDSDRLFTSVINTQKSNKFTREAAVTSMDLPDFVKIISGEGHGDIYHEINPSLQTADRLTGINALLSQIGYKCGFSNGYFVFNEKSGVATATQVEADQQRTVQLVKDVRDKLEKCLVDIFYTMDKFADLYNLAPAGKYDPVFDFGDILYSATEDKARWYSYVVQGKIPFWYYLVKFEGMTEEDAKSLEAAAQTAGLDIPDEE